MGKGRRSSERPLQKVLGQGADVNAANPLEVHDPKVGSLISYEGITTADGAADGSSLIDLVLATKADYDGHWVVITSGPYFGQCSDITAATTGGTITAHTAFDGQIISGTKFVILAMKALPAEVAALTTIVETNQYYDKVFFDSIAGIAGTAWPVGTPQVPSDVIADVITILAARNLRMIDIHGTLTLGAAMNHIGFIGRLHEAVADIVNLNTQDVDNSHFRELIITGAQAGAGLATYKECLLWNMTGFRGLAENCAIYGTLAVATGNADYADFDHCTSVHGQITVTIASPDRVSFKHFTGGMVLTAQAAGAVLIRGISGYLEVDAMVGGTLDIYAHGADIQINVNCTVGTINIYGNARVVGVGGGVVINNYTVDTNLATVDTVVDAIKVSTDRLAGQAPVSSSTTANWNTAEADVVSIGADDTRYKLHSLLLSIHNLVGTIITVRLYMQVNGVERKVYDQPFDATADPPGLWIVNGTIGIHEVLRVTLESNNAADNAKAVDYDYMLEAM